MLENDNIISSNFSEVVEEIPTDEKHYRKCLFLCFTLHSHRMKRAGQHVANSKNSCSPTRIHPM